MYFFLLLLLLKYNIGIIIGFYISDHPHIHNKLKSDSSFVIFTLTRFYLEL